MDENTESSSGRKRRAGFHDAAVRGLSITMLILGFLCLLFGSVTLGIALTSKCTFEHYSDVYYYGQTQPPPTYDVGPCRYAFTYSGSGIWSGFMYFLTGIIGVLSAKRKSTGLIVGLLVLSVLTTVTSAVSTAFAVLSNFDGLWGQINAYPIFLHVADSLIALCGVIAFIISWVKFGYACGAVCCSENGCCLTSTKQPSYQYHPLYSQPVVYQAGQNQALQGVPQVMHAGPYPQQVGSPVYFVNGQPVVGMQHPNPQQMQSPLGMQSSTGTATPAMA